MITSYALPRLAAHNSILAFYNLSLIPCSLAGIISSVICQLSLAIRSKIDLRAVAVINKQQSWFDAVCEDVSNRINKKGGIVCTLFIYFCLFTYQVIIPYCLISFTISFLSPCTIWAK